MVEKAIGESSDKQRDYITFLELVLKTAGKAAHVLKEKRNSGYNRIYFREKGAASDRWYGTQEDGWGNSLSCCVYNSIRSGTRALEISLSDDAPAGEFIYLGAKLSIELNGTPEKKNRDLAEEKINEVLEKLQCGFVAPKIVEKLKSDSKALFFTRRQLLTKESVFHLEKEEIKDYLRKYYCALVDFSIFYDAFEQEKERNTFIGELLRLDAVFNEEREEYQLDFWSPIALNKLQKVNDGVEAFFKQISENRNVENEWLQEIYRQTLLIKAQQNFRWCIPGLDQELIHAAIAPYVDYKSNSLKFQIAARSLKKYNSYEGIGELRLGEKIIYEYRLAVAQKIKFSQYRVAIMGDLHERPIEELHRYVEKKIVSIDKCLPIKFNIYTKNKVEWPENAYINYRGYPESVLLNQKKLREVIDTNNIVFILDCVELYRSLMASGENLEFVKQKYAFSHYDEYNTGFTKNADICDQNMLEELYEILTCEQCFHKFGRITKQANDSLLRFCEEKQKEKGAESTIYIYVSDLRAFNNIYMDDQYYIRTERYNQKEIGIIRYSSEKVRKLKVGNNAKMLVFNMWQFIKTVAINKRNMFISYVNESKDAYMDLDQIYIGIDYTDWPTLLEVHYYAVESKYEQVAVKFVSDVLLPVLNNHSQDMFNIYIKRAMYSFFYSAAKNVNDMLFIHLFQDKEEMLGKVVLAKENNEEKVKARINTRFKYSSKRFYDMIMKNYDISSNIYVGQKKTYHIIRKNELLDAKIDKNEIYQNVITACANLSYHGYLSKNCERIGLK